MSSGATNGGAAHQLHVRGTLDFHISLGAVRTYWRYQATPHTNFATELITQPFDNTPMWNGQTANATINRTGDLLHRVYIVVDLPAICAVSTSGYTSAFPVMDNNASASTGTDYGYYNLYDELFAGLQHSIDGYYCHWTDAIGFAMLREVQLSVGSHIVDKFTAEYLFAWEELSGQTGKRCWDMVGRFPNLDDKILFARTGGRLHVPLPFWFTQVTGNALSLITLHYNIVKLHVTFENLAKLVCVSNPDVKVCLSTVTNGVAQATSTSTELAASHLTAYIMCEMVYLDMAERTSFQQGEFDCLMTGVQTTQQVVASGSATEISLPFNFPVSELIFFGRMSANYSANKLFEFGRGIPSSANATGGQTANASSIGLLGRPMIPLQQEGTNQYVSRDMRLVPSIIGTAKTSRMRDSTGQYALWNRVIVNPDPFTDVALYINHSLRMATMPASTFRQLMPFQHHSRIPTTCIYVMSFSLFPEEANSSGALNFSKIDNAKLRLTIHPDAVSSEMTIFVIAKYWNIFSYTRGVGGARYRA